MWSVIHDCSRLRLGQINHLRCRWWLNDLWRCRKNDRHRQGHIDDGWLRNVRQLHIRQLDFGWVDLHHWRRNLWCLDLDRRRLGLLDRNRLGELGKLMTSVDRLFRGRSDED